MSDDPIQAYAAKQGWSWPLTPSQYVRAAVAVRPKKQAIRDAGAAIESRVVTAVGLRRVSLTVVEQNEATCRGCEKFATLRNAQPVCTVCNCSDKWLMAKWRDRHGYCRLGKWDNRNL